MVDNGQTTEGKGPISSVSTFSYVLRDLVEMEYKSHIENSSLRELSI